MALNLFNGGYLPLGQRYLAETFPLAICGAASSSRTWTTPEDLRSGRHAGRYLLLYSLFQPIPDSWAIKQLFPVMPIHRLNEVPVRQAVLGDITCDSDGKIDQFIDRRDVKRTLALHPFTGEPYYLGVFLVGAYQEILGDLHNLFGDTHAVHVSLDASGNVMLESVIKGDTVREVPTTSSSTRHVRASCESVEIAAREDAISRSPRLIKPYETVCTGYTRSAHPGER
jgi:arginine decarboxylase